MGHGHGYPIWTGLGVVSLDMDDVTIPTVQLNWNLNFEYEATLDDQNWVVALRHLAPSHEELPNISFYVWVQESKEIGS